MAAAIKRFFEKRKTAAKFRLAGAGHRLNDPAEKRPVPQSARSQPRPPSRQGPTEEQLQAAQAAMTRLSMPSKPGQKCKHFCCIILQFKAAPSASLSIVNLVLVWPNIWCVNSLNKVCSVCVCVQLSCFKCLKKLFRLLDQRLFN